MDSNTKGHIQWFYFSVKNGTRKQKLKMNICNLSRGKSLYNSVCSAILRVCNRLYFQSKDINALELVGFKMVVILVLRRNSWGMTILMINWQTIYWLTTALNFNITFSTKMIRSSLPTAFPLPLVDCCSSYLCCLLSGLSRVILAKVYQVLIFLSCTLLTTIPKKKKKIS